MSPNGEVMMLELSVGLVGSVGETDEGDLCLRLWRHAPFSRFLVRDAVKNRGGVTADASGREFHLGGGCPKSCHRFLSGLDAVLAVNRTWPDQLFAYAREDYSIPSLIVPEPGAAHNFNASCFRMAGHVLVQNAGGAALVPRRGVAHPTVLPLPWRNLAVPDDWCDRLWAHLTFVVEASRGGIR